MSATETIQAIAVKSGTSSTVASVTYTISSGTSSSTIPWTSGIMYGSVTDSRDSKVYKTVAIGTQTWMAENLNYAGTGTTVGVCYDSSADSCTKYGRLYTWAEAMANSVSSTASPSGVQGVCPSGWHVPSDAEWSTLTTFSGELGTKLKSTSGWYNSGNGTDIYGFRVLPAGLCNYVGAFIYVDARAYFWSASEHATKYAWYRDFENGNAGVNRSYILKTNSFSLRCLED